LVFESFLSDTFVGKKGSDMLTLVTISFVNSDCFKELSMVIMKYDSFLVLVFFSPACHLSKFVYEHEARPSALTTESQ
jgi:hypothetical protein